MILVCATFIFVVGILSIATYKRDTVFHYPRYASQYSMDLMKNARNHSKNVVLVFVSGTCSYCYSLFNGALQDNHLAENMGNVECLVVNKSHVSHRIIKQYNIHIYPSFVFIDKQGNKNSELVGYHKTDDIIKSIKALKNKYISDSGLPI